MRNVALVSDTACDIPEDLCRELDIHLAPVHVIIDDQEYRDRVNVDIRTVYRALRDGRRVTTAGCNANDWAAAYERAAQVGERIVAVSLSRVLSTTYGAAQLAIDATGLPVTLIDAGTILVPEGLAVLAGARAARRGADLDEVLRLVHKVLGTARMVAVADTIEFMRRGGRLAAMEAEVGSLEGYRPVLRISGRGWQPLDKDETRAGTIEKMLNIMRRDLQEMGCDRDTPLMVVVDHAGAEDEAAALLERLRHEYSVAEAHTWTISPAVGVHIGPGMLGVGYCPVVE
ncbi:MAG: DegV family protein [Clostridia bacterium]|nr:DegV family protein [Clostridia bacterium]